MAIRYSFFYPYTYQIVMQIAAERTGPADQLSTSRPVNLPPLVARYNAVRRRTEAICEPLETEDFVIQSMTDVSPAKWHLAHTTWFFESFVLHEFDEDYRPLDEKYAFLFNSYYIQAGDRFERARRGLLSRPTVSEVMDFRRYVDDCMHELLERRPPESEPELARVLEIGLNHEQQHQELMVADIKHVLSINPLYPAYSDRTIPPSREPGALRWIRADEGIVDIGHQGDNFCYDNEQPAHRVFLESFEIADRLVTNGEYLEFVRDGGYENPIVWLSEGWARVSAEGWTHPDYWIQEDGGWSEFTMNGKRALDMNAPVSHISYFEADAFARWCGARLPTEFEWERIAADHAISGHFSDAMLFHPVTIDSLSHAGPFSNLFGSVWEWTSSHYSPYPGYRAEPGPLGEYNGKFMCNQFVLRGGSVATPADHIRMTYRNFFPAYARWQFTGLRLVNNGGGR